MEEKSYMELWAEREIELACISKRKDCKNNDWEGDVACYKSAFAAFKALLGAGHTGLGISWTKAVLNRLIDGKPLTPIEDTDDIWEEVNNCWQCKRMTSLFKYVHSDGSIKYKDINRIVGIELSDSMPYYSGLITNIADELWPITMSYYPAEKPIKFFTETFLTDPKNGSFDTRAVFYAITPDDEKVNIDRYYMAISNDLEEIDLVTYNQRKRLAKFGEI